MGLCCLEELATFCCRRFLFLFFCLRSLMWDVLFVVLFGTGDNFYTGTPNHLNGELANKRFKFAIQVCHISSFPASKKPPPHHSTAAAAAAKVGNTRNKNVRRAIPKKFKKKIQKKKQGKHSQPWTQHIMRLS
jgi:hypothetical protein